MFVHLHLPFSLSVMPSKYPRCCGKWQISSIYLSIIFRERRRKGERRGEKPQCVVASHTPPTGDLACNPGTCPDWESNQPPFASQAHTQSTELHQSGLILIMKSMHTQSKRIQWHKGTESDSSVPPCPSLQGQGLQTAPCTCPSVAGSHSLPQDAFHTRLFSVACGRPACV